jgi:NADH-quinone oxidoreductase subunit G
MRHARRDDVVASRVSHVIALGGAAPVDATPLASAKVLTIAAHAGPLAAAAAVLLPATSWAEQSGTFVNAKGLPQVSNQALEPLGQCRPAWAQVAALAVALGYEPSWNKLKQIRSRLAGPAAGPGGASGTSTQTHGAQDAHAE